MDLQQLTLQDLRILRSLYRTHSQKETALALGLSSPTLSRRIAEMRELFGDKLFVRYANTMMPTPFMVEHIPAVERLVEGMRDLCEPSWFDPSSHQEVIRIGCIDYDLFSGLSVRTALMVRKAAPGIALEFRYLDLEIESKLANGSLDMVIWYWPLGSPNIHMMTLREPRPAVLVRNEHPLAKLQATLDPDETVPIEALHNYERICATYTEAQASCIFPFEAHQRTAFYVPSYGMGFRLLQHGDFTLSVPLLYDHDMLERLGLTVLRVAERTEPRTQLLLWHERTHASPARQWVRSILAANARQLAADPSTPIDPS
ncbi:LysR family transcriptional regulator [Sutterella megalosphaeroides]|uniref:LysR family transcriptional regulator n=1 Tax=Sutterella megalosphaeroides TaxID=2494234 RepID=A0A2Z6IBH5_9BURK|nr:LysR family transcriptional regulator [Sutterella megalosphaeroides]BBF22967.1 LysR family transcriptional regulator [Sutterella megalosphaeroides]